MGVIWKCPAHPACEKASPDDLSGLAFYAAARKGAKKTATEVTVFYDTTAKITEQPADRYRTLYSSGSRNSLRDLCQNS